MTDLPSIDLGYVQNPKLPILPFALDVYEAQCAVSHRHPRAQLIYSSRGAMKVVVKDKIWMVSSKQAIWVPGMDEHQVFFLKSNHIRNLFIDPSVSDRLPKECFALDVSPFLRELILKAVQNGGDYEVGSSASRLVEVLLDELALVQPTSLSLPTSNELHLKKVIDELIKDPSDRRSVEGFADLACTSSRTLSRLFVKELGLTFSDWRKQLRLIAAIELLEKGVPIAQISFDLGYGSPSSFIQMFSSALGTTPSKYLDR